MVDETAAIERVSMRLMSLFKTYSPWKRASGPQNRLCHDLGFGGDDFGEYQEEVSTQFNADFSKVDIWKYFPDEGTMISNWGFRFSA